MLRVKTIFAALAAALFFNALLSAQTSLGQITGAVTDNSGAAIPGAAVATTWID